MPNSRCALSPALAALLWITTASAAHAHISLDQAGTHKSRYGDNAIKQGPCGRSGGTRGSNVYTYAPGETITVDVVEFVPHPGYFRIAFDADGDDAFVDPASIPGTPPSGRTCSTDARDKCGEPDFDNNEAVLLDNLNPHGSAGTGKPRYSWKVQLPNVECERCTLQVIQVMTDKAPYVPGTDDLYYQCIDLVLRKGGAPATTAGAGAPPTGGTGAPAGSGGPAAEDSGCSVARTNVSHDGVALAAWLLLPGIALARSRRRRARSA